MFYAAEKGHGAVVDRLIAAGADVNKASMVSEAASKGGGLLVGVGAGSSVCVCWRVMDGAAACSLRLPSLCVCVLLGVSVWSVCVCPAHALGELATG